MKQLIFLSLIYFLSSMTQITRVPGKLLQDGSVTPPKMNLQGFTATQPGEPMNLQTTNNRINAEKLTIEAGSQSYAEIVNNQLRIKALAVTQTIVDVTNTNLADSLAANYPNGDELQSGDFLIIQNFLDEEGNTKTRTYQHIGTSNGDETDFLLAEKADLSDLYIKGLFRGVEGIDFNPATGEFKIADELPKAIKYRASSNDGLMINNTINRPNGAGAPNGTDGLAVSDDENKLYIISSGIYIVDVQANNSVLITIVSGANNGVHLPSGSTREAIIFNNNLYVATGDGLYILDTQTLNGTVRNAANPPANGVGADDWSIGDVKQYNGKIYCALPNGSGLGVWIYDPATDTGELVDVSGASGDNLRFSGADCVDAFGDWIFAGFSSGLYIYNTNTGVGKEISPFIAVTSGDRVTSSAIRAITTKESDNQIWVGTSNGIWRYNVVTDAGLALRNDIANTSGDAIFTGNINYIVAKDGIVYAGGFNGLYVYNEATQTGTIYNATSGNVTGDNFIFNNVDQIQVIGDNVHLATNSGYLRLAIVQGVDSFGPDDVAPLGFIEERIEAATTGLQRGIPKTAPLDCSTNGADTGIVFPSKPIAGLFFLTLGAAIFDIDEDVSGVFYVSRDGGTTALAWENIEPGDGLYFNAVIAGFNLVNADDLISVKYES